MSAELKSRGWRVRRNIWRSCIREKAVWCFIPIELHQNDRLLTHVHYDIKPLLLPSVETQNPMRSKESLLSNPQW